MPKKHKDRTDEIVQSSAFNVLNMLADELADEMWLFINSAQERMKSAAACDPKYNGVSVRVSQEHALVENHELPLDPVHLRDIGSSLIRVRELEDMIGRIQRFKLRLLGDYDFCHGDLSSQEAVFGKPK